MFPLGVAMGGLGLAFVIVSCSHRAPVQAPQVNSSKHPSRYHLVHVPDAVPGVHIDLRYRTSGNATGKPLYPPDMPCLLNRSAADKLRRAQQQLKQDGFSLKILDAWRPPEAHMALWNAVKDPLYVVPPSDGLSLHCYGIAVDVTLVDLQTGRDAKMPSKFDEFSPRAKSVYTGPDKEIARNVTLLRSAMIKAGFRGIPDEWWHFDMPGTTRVFRVTAKDLGIRLPL
jgi:D-alanyl-D-alanine dipeptidase